MDSLTVEQRILALQSQLNAMTQPQATTMLPEKQVESIEELVNRAIDAKLASLSKQITDVPQQPIDYGTQLLVAVGSALTEEQQLWLSNEINRIDIPMFLSSTEGQSITRRFFTMYKQFKDSKCK